MIVGISASISCTKEMVTKGKDAHVYPVYKNSYRAKTITGKNEAWGEFKLYLNYKGEDLAVSYRVDNETDTVGSITRQYSAVSNSAIYNVQDFVVNISQDSINRLDNVLKEKYGEGNYSLKDSVYRRSRAARSRMEVVNNLHADGRVKMSTFTYFKPQDEVSTSDKDFTTDYEQVRSVVNKFEYNLDGYVIVNRLHESIFKDPKDLTKFDRRIFKHETIFDKSVIVNFIEYELFAGDNFTELDNYSYSYSGGKLMSVAGKNQTRSFVYSGSNLEITIGEEKFTYTFDGNNNVTKMADSKGNYMNIEYEAGHGDFSSLTPFFEIQLGMPYIK